MNTHNPDASRRVSSLAFIVFVIVLAIFASLFTFSAHHAEAAYHFSNYSGHSPLHIYTKTGKTPVGMTPAEIKSIYNLPDSGGSGTIVIVGAYHNAAIEKDLAAFDTAFNLPECTLKNKCFTQHSMGTKTTNTGWNMETALDVEWAHAIAPTAKILLVEAKTPSGANLLKAVDYAAKQSDASAISMSWGGPEFPEQTTMDSHFASASGAPFFASSGDSGTGASWPAASPNVIAVGGTSILLDSSGALKKESAWEGSGGGLSAYEQAPDFQVSYSIPKSNGMRAVPDVAYDADPKSGFPIVHKNVWYTVGGTSAGAPQWAGIAALGSGITAGKLYTDKASGSAGSYFRDIVSGTNGSCGYYCKARTRYDYVTGLGTPQTSNF